MLDSAKADAEIDAATDFFTLLT